jgi:murein DD-endopeptidase MepM/ murein hydrolase activator NlpD
MRFLCFLCVTFIFSGCTIRKINSKDSDKDSVESLKEKIREFSPISLKVSPGKLRYVEIVNPPVHQKKLLCDGKEIVYQQKQNKIIFYLAESYFSNRSFYQCYLDDLQIAQVTVVPFPYKEEVLHVDQKRVFLSKIDQARVARENKMLNELYAKYEKDYLFTAPFVLPLNSFVTSHYGNKRLFNNKKSAQHLGNDFRAQVGTKIPASNRAKVLFTGDLFYSGLVVILDHGGKIFTNYGHLSKILVKQGDIVEKGEIVGLSGATGRVSGPHLHWGLKVEGEHIDGFSLVEESLKHFNEK